MRFIIIMGLFLGSMDWVWAQSIPETSETENYQVALPRVSLNSTVSKPLSLRLTKGTLVYNTYGKISGTRQYPAQGEGVYTFDGQGWMATPVEALPFSKMKEVGPSFGNAVLLLEAGSFTPPPAEESTGIFYLLRNTHAFTALDVLNVVDFGKKDPGTLKISPKEGSLMIYSDGKLWYRLQ